MAVLLLLCLELLLLLLLYIELLPAGRVPLVARRMLLLRMPDAGAPGLLLRLELRLLCPLLRPGLPGVPPNLLLLLPPHLLH